MSNGVILPVQTERFTELPFDVTEEFIKPENWPLNSLDHNLVDFLVRGALKQKLYHQRM